jgi:hypothetical protein
MDVNSFRCAMNVSITAGGFRVSVIWMGFVCDLTVYALADCTVGTNKY